MLKKSLWLAMIAILAVGLLAACGGGKDKKESTKKAEETVTIEAKNFEFDKKEYKIPANKDVALKLKNVEGSHGLMVEGEDVNISGDNSDVVNLKPGEYTIRCSVPCGQGHANMVSKLVVE
ncbi:cupredoxin domain-containing protein [Bacillus sp. NEB1478]|uniref:cupredoxin domain-containing protein n=1 Tax=Bacillus sp. NEB1478 TaxID=3073816 RepID=UPI002872D98D|nr:cupredoxin domain-containing protein [Bacillus sp. NEB1478]WNB90732.1 cupredoxin domain-containing protein [Bacillus sp. NEB1478]